MPSELKTFITSAMGPAFPLHLRILFWLLILACGGDKEGNAIPFPSFRPAPRHRLITDNFLQRPRSSIPFSGVIGYQGASGPSFPGHVLDQMEVSNNGNTRQFHSLAVMPGFGARRATTSGNRNRFGDIGTPQRSPFKSLFGRDIDSPSGVLDSTGISRRENAFSRVENPSEESSFGTHRSHPFSSLRLTPVTKLSGVRVVGPNRGPRRLGNNFENTDFDGMFRGNRAQNYEHEDPFEKPISRSAFPLPSVNDPITLDLAADERDRVKYATEKNKLPPPRSFVYKGQQDTPEDIYRKPKLHDDSLSPFAVGSNIGAVNHRLNLPAIPPLPSERTKQNQESVLMDPAQRSGQNETSLTSGQSAVPEIDALASEMENPEPSDQNGSDIEVDDSIGSAEPDSSLDKAEDGPINSGTQLSNNYISGHDFEQDKIFDQPSFSDTQGAHSVVPQDIFPDEYDQPSNKPLTQETKDEFDRNDAIFTSPQDSRVYDKTTLTQEKIHKQSGKLLGNITVSGDLNTVQAVDSDTIPAIKQVIEESIESGKRTVKNNKTILPTDHVGFILTDEIYDDYDGPQPPPSSSDDTVVLSKSNKSGEILENPSIGTSFSENEFLNSASTNFIPGSDSSESELFQPDFIVPFQTEVNVPNDTPIGRPPVGSSYLLADPETDAGLPQKSGLGSDEVPGTTNLNNQDQALLDNYLSTNFNIHRLQGDGDNLPGTFSLESSETNGVLDTQNIDFQNPIQEQKVSTVTLQNTIPGKESTQGNYKATKEGDNSITSQQELGENERGNSLQEEQSGQLGDNFVKRVDNKQHLGDEYTSEQNQNQLIDENVIQDASTINFGSTTLNDFDDPNNVGDDFEINSDPLSPNFNLLNAGEGSINVRKKSNTFDPSHKDVNVVETSFSSTEQPKTERQSQFDNQNTLPKYGKPIRPNVEASTSSGVPDTIYNGPNEPQEQAIDRGDDISPENESMKKISEDSESIAETDDAQDDEYGHLFRPASSYAEIEFPTPSSDAFTSSSAFVSNNDGPSSSRLRSPFQSMFGKSLAQAEQSSFGSLFQNLPNSDKESKATSRDSSRSNKGLTSHDSGFFGGRLFDDRLEQIIESRPSLDMFGGRWK